MVLPWIQTGFHVTGPTRGYLIEVRTRFQIRDCHPLWFRIPSDSSSCRICNFICEPHNPAEQADGLGIIPFRSPLLREVAVAFLSCGYLDVSVHHVRPVHLCIQCTVIQGSRDQRSFDSSPKLFAAFHALHRLLTPRHPPHALTCSGHQDPRSFRLLDPGKFKTR